MNGSRGAFTFVERNTMIVLTGSDRVTVQLEVLTLEEAAAFLRVSEESLLALAMEGAIPAQKIGADWRFLKEGLADWLRYGPRFYREFSPHWMSDEGPLDRLLMLLEKRLSKASDEPAVKPGSKQAVQKHFGVWRDDPTAEALLADIYKRRQEEPGSEE